MFPTTSILDNFNRSDAISLGTNWFPGFGGYFGVFGISSNQMDVYSQSSSYTQGYWTFGPNAEAYITVVDWGATARINLSVKLINPDFINMI